MKEEKVQLILGGLLHDIGKVVYRQGDGRAHSISGSDFLKEEVGLKDNQVIESVRYHHGKELRNANISDESFAYITYIADNIASAVDRRKNESEDVGFEVTAPIESVFNILNGNQANFYYQPGMLGENETINFPSDKVNKFDQSFYIKIVSHIKENLQGIEWTESYINSILAVLEANLSYVPSSTAKDELADISLYDHVKLTGAINSCIYDYLKVEENKNYKEELFKQANQFYGKQAFLLASMDMSGIQDFIYTISSEGALRMLRAKSFYLEIMMEHITDTLLSRCEQTRANLIYIGGGHCYILLPNTNYIKEKIESFENELNEWMQQQFQTDLYVAIGYVECSANELKNEPRGSYSDVFRGISEALSRKKSCRYTANQIINLNKSFSGNHTRECKVCKRMGALNEKEECPMCSRLSRLSGHILYTDFFIVSSKEEEGGLPLPFNEFLYALNEQQLRDVIKSGDDFIRSYSKNKYFTGKNIATKLWVANYTTGDTFSELASKADGIERIGILRADVDNLGATFVSGFENEVVQDRYVTLSRTATLSRLLVLFFKYHINSILDEKKRNAAIVYSGGDDLFIVGAWNEVIEIAIDIQQAFKKYTENTLTISAGIGIYQDGYPIHASAREVAELEEDSKSLPGKNALTVLPDGVLHAIATEKDIMISDGTYSWDDFIDSVIGVKYKILDEFFNQTEERGKNFLYNLLDLVRKQDDKINLARYVYLLSRLEPDQKASDEEKENYRAFSKQMYLWISSEKDCRELKTAITLYSYKIREKEVEV